jgi:integrase
MAHCSRDGVLYADGRSNKPSPGRHSLGTADHAEALKIVTKLDFRQALKLGLVEPTTIVAATTVETPLPVEEAWAEYRKHIQRSRVAGGTKPSTQKRYRAIFDKFLAFTTSKGVEMWNRVTDELVYEYSTYLERSKYAPKTVETELVTLLQAHKFLLRKFGNDRLRGVEPIRIRVKSAESERPYCYTTEQVCAMIQHCRASRKLAWLADVIVGLATTGLRISELACLRWSDVADGTGMIVLTDESGHAARAGRVQRETKSSSSRRLPIHADLAATLASLSRSDTYIFHGPRGGRLKPDTVRHILVRDVLKPLAKRFPSPQGEKGFCDGRLHSFRHYFASRCAQNPDISEATTMEWLGHADSEMTRHYFHLHDEQSKWQMSRMDLLGEAGQQRTGVQCAAVSEKEPTSRDNDPTIAT